MGYISRDTSPNDGRSISPNVAHLNILNILVHGVISLLYYEYWTVKQKYFTYKQHYQCNISQDNNDEAQKQHLLGLPYKSHKGEKGSTQWENG